MNVFDLAAKITLNTDGYVSALGKMAKLGTASLTAAGVAIGAFAKSAITTGQEFDKSMSQVAATMGLTMEQMMQKTGSVELAWGTFTGNLREYAQEMGEHTAFSAKQASDALNYMALAGYDVQTSMEMLPNVLNLAAAGNMELATASDMVTDTQTAFGISLERTTQMVDEMAKASSTGNTTVEQMGDAFLTVGGLAQELNGGFITLADGTRAEVDGIQELEIALTAMANAGTKGSEAGTHMRNMLLKLSSPTSEGTQRLEAMGVAVFDTEGKMRSLSDIFGDLDKSLSTMTQQEKIQAISELFNTRDLASAEALLNAVGQDWDEIGESILNAQGAAQQMADTQMDNLAGDITYFQSALDGAKITLSDQLTPSLRKFVQFGTSSVSTLTKAFKEQGLTGAMEAFGGILSEGLTMLVEGAPKFVEAASTLVNALFDGLIAAMPQIAKAAARVGVQFASGIGQLMPRMLKLGAELFKNLFNGITEAVPELIPLLLDTLDEMVDTLLDNADDFLDAGIEMIMALGQGLIDALPRLSEKIPQIVTALVSKWGEMFPKIVQAGVELFSALIADLPTIISNIAAAIPDLIKALVDTILGNIQALIDAGVKLFVALVENLPAIIEGIVAAIPEIIKAILDSLGGLGEAIAGVFSAAWELVVAAWDGVVTFFAGIWDSVVAVFEGVAEWFGDIFSDAWEAITDAWDAVVEWFSDIWTGITDVFKTVGGWFSDKFSAAWRFIKEAWAGVVNFFQGIWDGITRIFESIGQWFSDVFSEAVRLIKEAWEGIVQFFTDIWDCIMGPIRDFDEWLGEKMGSAAEKGRQGFQEGLGDHVPAYFRSHVTDPIKKETENAQSWGSDMVQNFINGLEGKQGLLASTMRRLLQVGIKDPAGHSVPKTGPLRDELTWMPHMMQNFAKGIRDNAYLVQDAIDGAMDFTDIEPPEIGINGSRPQGYTQTINIYSPKALTPYEVARQTRNATQSIALQLRGVR